MTQNVEPVVYDEELHNGVICRIEHVTGLNGHVAYKVLKNGEVVHEAVVKFSEHKRMGPAFREAATYQYQIASKLADED